MDESDSKQIGLAVRVSREKLNWSQTDLAEKIGVSRSMISKFESGNRSLSEEKLNQLWDCLTDPDATPINRVIVDYLTIHFFSLDYQTLTKEILGISATHFEEREYAPLGYTAQLIWNNAITISYSADDSTKGTLINLPGQGCAHMVIRFRAKKITWQDFFQNVLNHQGNFT